MQFDNQPLHVIREFASELNLPFQAARDGSFNFVFQSTGELSVTASPDGRRIFISLARLARPSDDQILHRTLQQSGFNPTTNRLIYSGLDAGGKILFAISVLQTDFDLPQLKDCFEALSRAHDATG